jgi:hypothetical protein
MEVSHRPSAMEMHCVVALSFSVWFYLAK